MTTMRQPYNSRRDFIRGAGALACGALTLTQVTALTASSGVGDSAAAIEPVPVHQSFGPGEAMFVEAVVDKICPAGDMTPAGTTCGRGEFMDRQLAGAYRQDQGSAFLPGTGVGGAGNHRNGQAWRWSECDTDRVPAAISCFISQP